MLGALHDRAHRSAGDYSRSRRRRFHQNFARAMLSDDLVRNRSAGHRDSHHVAARSVNGLADRFRNFIRFPRREADLPLTVADSDKRVEREAPSALHDLGDAIDGDDVFDELVSTLAASAVASVTRFSVASSSALTPRAAASAAALTAATATTTCSAAATRRTLTHRCGRRCRRSGVLCRRGCADFGIFVIRHY